jgi:hypothetical protein
MMLVRPQGLMGGTELGFLKNVRNLLPRRKAETPAGEATHAEG